jgi:hypothetical protein
MDDEPGRLLGMPLLDPRGALVGTVVDVGLRDYRHARFLLVRDARCRLLRVELDTVALAGDALRLRGGLRA